MKKAYREKKYNENQLFSNNVLAINKTFKKLVLINISVQKEVHQWVLKSVKWGLKSHFDNNNNNRVILLNVLNVTLL